MAQQQHYLVQKQQNYLISQQQLNGNGFNQEMVQSTTTLQSGLVKFVIKKFKIIFFFRIDSFSQQQQNSQLNRQFQNSLFQPKSEITTKNERTLISVSLAPTLSKFFV